MELSTIFSVLRDRWLTVSVAAFLVVATTGAATLLMTPQYTSSVRMFFAVQGGESVNDLVQGSNFTEKQMASYAEVARSPLVLEPVIEKLGLSANAGKLAGAVKVAVAANTTILVISATDTEPAVARDIANAVSEELSSAVSSLSPERPDGGEAVRATMLSEARLPNAQSSPDSLRNLVLGVLLGLMVGVALAVMRQLLDTKVRSESDVSSLTGSSVLATVPMETSAKTGSVFMHDDPMSTRAEAVRRLRTNLQFVDFTDRPNSILVTSSISGEGKSTTAINLAASLSDAGSRVILIDADLRRPSIAKYMGFEGRVGLTTVLIGKAQLADVVQPWRDTSLDVLASGQIPPNPSELLGSLAMSRLLENLGSTYDFIIIDSPPILPVTDSTILSKMTGGTLLVAGADRIHKAQISGSLEELEKVEARLLGIVLNKADAKGVSNYYGEYRSIEDPTLTGNRRATKPNNVAHARRSARR